MKTRKNPVILATGRVTIRDIAERLNISHTTVSRSLANNPKISDSMRNRVRTEARRSGYVANAAARAIRTSSSQLAGIVIPNIKNDFYASVAKVIGERLSRNGLQLILCVTDDDPNRELSAIRALAESRAAGLVITLSSKPRAETLRLLARLNAIQLVRVCRSLRAPAVVIDDERAVTVATEHLISLGHRRLAYVGAHPHFSSGRDRLQGFRTTVAKHGLATTAAISLGAPSPGFASSEVLQIMRAEIPPSGIVFASSELTLGGLQALGKIGKKYPDEVSVVGFGDPAWFGLAGSGISTVRLPEEEIGQAAATCLIDEIGNTREPLPRKLPCMVFASTLIARESSGPAPQLGDRPEHAQLIDAHRGAPARGLHESRPTSVQLAR